MMKKQVFLTLILLLAVCILKAQDYVPSRDDINAFFNTKTMVVLDDNPLLEYNIVIKEVMEQEWKVTDFDFISFKEFEELRKDPQYSFLYMGQVRFDNDKTDAQYRFMHLSLGGDYYRLNQMPDLAAVPLAYYSVEEDNYIYKLALLVRFMQNHVKLIKEQPEIVSANVFKHYNDNIKDIKSRTLYVLEDELSKEVNSAARIKKVYPFKFKIVTKDEITEAIKKRDENIVFLHKVGPEGTKLDARCYKVIIGAGDAQFYYFDYHRINSKKPDGLLESDFKAMAKK
ncbi:MAG: hypothetical protein JXA77_03580 [Bacteroidales bacterium]|nr:hypothetical protein [Bacteroidales bacterium]MBN2818452.1 hypothetical protein [Bacteroidales bacterium]